MNTTIFANFGLISMGAAAMLLSACVSQPTYNANYRPNIVTNAQGVPSHYLVRQGDTISKIANRYQLNWQNVAAMNRLDKHNTIYTGQWLVLHKDKAPKATKPATPKHTQSTLAAAQPRVVTFAPITENSAIPMPQAGQPKQALSVGQAAQSYQYTTPNTQKPTQSPPVNAVMATDLGFVSPVHRQNQAVRNFGEVRKIDGNTFKTEGVWFSGREGDAIVASRAGTVIYADPNQLPDASIAIRHTDGFITEYRFIKDATIKSGQNVNAGQRIASMRTNNGAVVTEFRVSKNNVYIDPLSVIR